MYVTYASIHNQIFQESKTDKDEENSRKINEVLNNPPTPGSQRSGGATPGKNR